MKNFLKHGLPIIFLVAFINSCEKDPVVPEQETLEEQFPEWSNLSWVSTDGVDSIMDPNIYPRLYISIANDEAVITEKYNHHDVDYYNWRVFTKLIIVGDVITFTNENTIHKFIGIFTSNDDTITVTTSFFNGITERTYILQKHNSES